MAGAGLWFETWGRGIGIEKHDLRTWKDKGCLWWAFIDNLTQSKITWKESQWRSVHISISCGELSPLIDV